MSIQWKAEPPVPTPASREEAQRLINGGARAEVDLAFRDGVLVDYAKQVIGDGNDLEIRLVLRHKSAVPDAPAAGPGDRSAGSMLDNAVGAALGAISGDDEVGAGEMLKAVRAALVTLRQGPTVHKVPATVDGRYADIVTINQDGWAAMIDAVLSEET